MTREEALDYLKHIKENYTWCCEEDALEMAIKALEQETCKCFTCKYGEWKRKGWDITMADDKCGGCSSWNDKYEPLEQEPKTGWIPVSKGTTNGDVLCMLFPNMHYTLSDKSQRVVTTIGVVSSFDLEWWNAPYQSEVSE